MTWDGKVLAWGRFFAFSDAHRRIFLFLFLTRKKSKNAALATTADGHWHERPEGAKAVFSRGPLVLLPFYPRGGAGAAVADSRLPRKAESTLNETKRAQRIFFTGL